MTFISFLWKISYDFFFFLLSLVAFTHSLTIDPIEEVGKKNLNAFKEGHSRLEFNKIKAYF